MDKVFGENSHQGPLRTMNDFNTPVMQYMFRNVWDGIWSGDGIEPKYRSLIVIRYVAPSKSYSNRSRGLTVSILGATGKLSQLKVHVRGGLRNGLTEGEIREAMMHIMGYCGFPTGLDA